MTNFGYTLSSEEFGPAELVQHGRRAEEEGFEFVTISDHFHPWTQAQGHSPFVWTTVAGVAATTERIRMGTGVTCPLLRIHPVIVAQAAASSSALSNGRFFLGVGTGERLNEHILGQHWPPIEVRREMLTEAIMIMRELWTGETFDHQGTHYTVENARIFDPPSGDLQVIAAASGTSTAEHVGEFADGLWTTSPSNEVVEAYRRGGGQGAVYAQLTVCVAGSDDEAKRTALEIWPTAGMGGQLSQELATWSDFESVAELVTEEHVASSVVCTSEAQPIVDRIREYEQAGIDHIHVHQIGRDQDRFFSLWTDVASEVGASVLARS
jgi:coenzyme F420-dependent glucose-6-phosphate dehydrogenase